MNILAINPFKLTNNRKQLTTPEAGPYFGLKMAKPLSRDVVSFGNIQNETAPDTTPMSVPTFKMSPRSKFLNSRVGGVSKSTAIKINRIAEEIQPEIESFIRGLFSEYMVTAKKPNNLIAYIKGRAKKPDSIVEKSKVIEENTIAGVFNKMTDLNATKIVLQKGDRNNVHKVLDILADAIKRGLIILEEVEVKRPAASKKLKGKDADKWDYADSDKLQQFVTNAEKDMGKKVNFPIPDLTPSNYPALHFLLRLPGQKRVFELQLMGLNVSRFKDLDDILYKVLDNKNADNKFKPIVNTLKPVIMTKEDKDLLKYSKIREKIDRLKFSEPEYYLLLSRLVQEEELIQNGDEKEFIDKIEALLRAKDIKKEELSLLITRSELEIPFQDKELMKKFKNKVDLHNKFNAYRAQAFLFQREKKTSAACKEDEFFLPLSEDLPGEFDLNKLYQQYLSAINN